VRSYVSPNTLVFWGIWESVEICHGDSHISVWCFEHLLVPHHVEGVVKVIRDLLSLLFICSSLSTVGIALLALLPLLVSFSIDDRSSLLTLKTKSPRRGGKIGKLGKPRG
jgi:hypothetical protein